MYALKDLFHGARRAQHRLPPGRRQARRRARPRELAVQLHHRRASSRPTRSCWSAPIRASRRRAQRAHPQALAPGALTVGVIGEQADLTYPLRLPGRRAGDAGRTRPRASTASPKALKAAKRPLIIVGAGALARADGAAVLPRAGRARPRPCRHDGWNGFNVLHTAASRVGGLDLGFVPGEGGMTAGMRLAGKGELDVLFLLGADEIDIADRKAFVVYLGSHGDAGATAPT